MNIPSATYCPAPWISLNLIPGEIRPCCQWHGGCNPDTNFTDIKNNLLAGNILPGCIQCHSHEKVGTVSRRQQLIEKYGVVTDSLIKILDISFDNICNLKCRGCTSFNSHLWYNDEQEMYGETFVNNKYLELSPDLDIDIANLEDINISGGEPFLSKKFDQFADRLLKEKDLDTLSLTINTNGTVKPSPIVYELMLKVETLNISVSIDGLAELNHYFRHGADFNKCIAMLELFKKLKLERQEKVTNMQIHTTVSIYNVNLLDSIDSFFQTTYPEFYNSHRLLYWPTSMSIRNIPQDLKEKLKPIVEAYGERYEDVKNELNSQGTDMFDEFINVHNTLDILRKESLKTANPFLFDYISRYKNNTQSGNRILLLKQMIELIK
jgi:sulfatase maturation enzyme AslB (radical SAM superfamily)